MAEEVVSRPGTACIKQEYLRADHSRELNLEFVANKDKRSLDDSDVGKDSIEQPRKKKLKGQNKHRPREKRQPKSGKLCFRIGSLAECNLGDRCQYTHDVESYLANKPQDIGDKCYLFDSFGNCPYSFSCRFALQHTVDQKNIINEELWERCKNDKRIFNTLDKNIQAQLRKHKFNFSRSKNVLKAVLTRCKKTSDVEENRDISADIQNADIEKGHTFLPNQVESGLGDNGHEKTLHFESKDISLDIQDGDIEKDNAQLPNQVESALEDKGHEKTLHFEKKASDFPKPIEKHENYKPLDEVIIKLRPGEKKKVDFQGKLYLAPLTTVGNLPFRRICKTFGADITCGEMAMATSILQGQQSEWALLKRHHTEDIFGVQVCGSNSEVMTKCAQLLTDTTSIDFIDINMGCPLDPVYTKGAGCGLMNRLNRMDDIILGMSTVANVPLTVKMRAGVYANQNTAHNVIKRICRWDDCVSLITVHGRSRVQRYTKYANWSYINECAQAAHPIPLFGSGDIMSYEDYDLRCGQTGVAGGMIARGALIKPWIFTEIKERRHWDISSSERMDILKTYVNYGLEHWGSDTEGIEKVRRFLLEWLSFLYRYIPVGLLERVPQHINERPPPYHGRDELETLMASPSCASWVKISEMLLGPVQENFVFLPKHKANAYQ